MGSECPQWIFLPFSSLLKRIGAKGYTRREDLSSTLHVRGLNGELKGQVAAVVRVGDWNPQWSQDIFHQFDVAG